MSAIALNNPLGSYKANLVDFEKFLVGAGHAAVEEVRTKVNVNHFWDELLSALESDAFGLTLPDRQRLFKVVYKDSEIDLPEWQKKTIKETERAGYVWKRCLIYFQPEPVLDMLREWKRRKTGAPTQLDRSDLQSQMRTREYWVPPPEGQSIHRQRFHGVKGNKTCWCIDLDKHEKGYQHVGEPEWDESLHQNKEVLGVIHRIGIDADKWTDPRRGDLFGLVDALEKQAEPSKEEEGAK